jgi:hypothetical protein
MTRRAELRAGACRLVFDTDGFRHGELAALAIRPLALRRGDGLRGRGERAWPAPVRDCQGRGCHIDVRGQAVVVGLVDLIGCRGGLGVGSWALGDGGFVTRHAVRSFRVTLGCAAPSVPRIDLLALSSVLWRRCTPRSWMASARVGSLRLVCRAFTGSWLVIKFEREPIRSSRVPAGHCARPAPWGSWRSRR